MAGVRRALKMKWVLVFIAGVLLILINFTIFGQNHSWYKAIMHVLLANWIAIGVFRILWIGYSEADKNARATKALPIVGSLLIVFGVLLASYGVGLMSEQEFSEWDGYSRWSILGAHIINFIGNLVGNEGLAVVVFLLAIFIIGCGASVIKPKA